MSKLIYNIGTAKFRTICEQTIVDAAKLKGVNEALNSIGIDTSSFTKADYKKAIDNLISPSEVEPIKSITITSNKTEQIRPTNPYQAIAGANITVNVPQETIEENKSQSISSNGETVITPSKGNTVMKKVTVNVNVPATPTQEKTATVNSKTPVVVTPDSGKVLSKVTINLGDADTLLPENIKKGVTILGVTGTLETTTA